MAATVKTAFQIFALRCIGLERRFFNERIQKVRYQFAKYYLLSLGGINITANESVLDAKNERTTTKTETNDSQFGHNHNKDVHTDSSGRSSVSSPIMTFEPNDPRLRSSECLKNAAGLAVDSSSAVLSQTVYAVANIEAQYVELVTLLVSLMEHQLQVLGHHAEEERVADLILKTRHKIDDVYRRKQDLAFLYASVKKLAEATAEVAFAAGANYASTSIGERLHSADFEIKQLLATSEEAEKRMRSTEVKSIQVMSQHQQNKERLQERPE